MTAEIGQYALTLALMCALVQALIPMAGSFGGRSNWMSVGRPAAQLQCLFVAIAYGCLTYAFVAHDFSILYVASTSNTNLPLMYRLSGVWGGHEGSILLWIFVLSLWTLAVTLWNKSIPYLLQARVISILGMISIGFLLFLLLTSNPFERLFPIPIDGASLNPLLQDPGMAFHPPLLYMGYVGFSVAFAFAVAALIGGQLDSATLRWMRPWTNIAWMFLTLGIALGSYWAYYELGWGGWWFWDPVENASFMPWLAGTALIHSLAASEKRGVFKAWTVLLAVTAFSLSLLGTFLVRSGVLTSVHAFASDPTRGTYILIFLFVVVGGSLLLFATRANRLVGSSEFTLFSREAGILLNNILLVVACLSVLLGTLYPLFIDALELGKISVGPPYFNAVFIPLTAPLAVFVGLGALAGWKRGRLEKHKIALLTMAIASAVAAVLFALRAAQFNHGALLAIGLACWVLCTTIYGIFQRLKHRSNKVSAVAHTPAAFWGMVLAHLGIAVFTVGVAITSIYSVEKDLRMAPGDAHDIGDYRYTFNGVEQIRGPNYAAAQAEISVTYKGEPEATLYAQKRIYDVRKDSMTEAGIDGGFTRDLFTAIGEPLGDGAWSVRLYYKPFIRWIWLGALLMGLGGLLAALDKRYRIASRSRASSPLQVPTTGDRAQETPAGAAL